MDNHVLPETHLSRIIDGMITRVGKTASWLWIVLLAIVVTNVGLRYIAGEGYVELEELQWHVNSVAFLIAIAYCYRVDGHIRIDLVSSRLRPRLRAWIELYGTLLLLVPFVVMLVVFSVPFVAESFKVSEISQSPGGLPYRWALKAVIPLALGLLLLGMLARLSRLWAYLSDPATQQIADSLSGVDAGADAGVDAGEAGASVDPDPDGAANT